MDIVTQRLIVFRKKVLAEFRRFINQESESIPKKNQSDHGQDNPEPLRVEVRSELSLPVSVTEYCDSEQKHRKANVIWERLKTCSEIGGVLIAVALAFFTFGMLRETRKQATAAQGQLEVLQAGRRPWLGVDGEILTNPVLVRVDLRYPYVPKETLGILIRVDGTFNIRNFGTSPAFDVRYAVHAIPAYGDFATQVKPPPSDCKSEDYTFRSGEVIFPGQMVPAPFRNEKVTPVPIPPLKGNAYFASVWMIGCIRYKESRESKTFHSTNFWLTSTTKDGSSKWVDSDPDIRYSPAEVFHLWGTDAD